MKRAGGELLFRRFKDLPALLPDNSLLVANNSKVLPARLFGKRETGGKVEFLLLTPLPLLDPLPGAGGLRAEAEGLLRASKGLRPGEMIEMEGGLRVEVEKVGEFGKSKVVLHWSGELAEIFLAHGHQPLPPYIKRPDSAVDFERYQTVYAEESKLGSVAAPTAGLHFTPELRDGLQDAGHLWRELTLYVGYGTFSPVRESDIRRHRMHEEYVEIPSETAKAVAEHKKRGLPVVAVGTTSVRALEGAFAKSGKIAAFAGWTDLFITPGFEFKITDHMLTNFHLPESSLLIMVSAFAGRQAVLNAYNRALVKGFRFFSYGDAMFIL